MGLGTLGVIGIGLAAMIGLVACEQKQPPAETKQEAPAPKVEATPQVETAPAEEAKSEETAAVEAAEAAAAPEGSAEQTEKEEGATGDQEGK